MTYTKTSWLAGEAGGTLVTSARLNNLETQHDSAISEINATLGMFASANGVVGDGVTDDSEALNALLTAAAAAGVSVILDPLSIVLVQSTLLPPSGTRLNLNGATIKRGATGSGVLINLIDRSDISIRGGTLDGNKAAYPAATEWRHNINLDNSKRIVLRDLYSNSSKGDGIYIGGTVTHCEDVDLFNVSCDGNYRQGLSIVGVDGFTAVSSRFVNTAGTAPQSGVDVEPNRGDQVCKNIRFTGCTFSGNAGHGFLVALQASRTAVQGGITLTGCTSDSNTTAGVRLTESEGVQIVGGGMSGNFQGLLHDTNTMANTKVIGVIFSKNSQHGVSVYGAYSDLTFSECTLDSNGQTTIGDGFNIAPSATSTGLRLIGNRSAGSPQRNGVTLGANCSGVMMVGNEYAGNTTARSGTSVITLDLDAAGKRTISGSRGSNTALASTLTQLAGMGLITDSTTA